MEIDNRETDNFFFIIISTLIIGELNIVIIFEAVISLIFYQHNIKQ